MAGNPKAQALRDRLAKGEFILAPGIYDGISARVADGMGFPALYSSRSRSPSRRAAMAKP
jgi:2-methylisocitrate lyase-like PEP mutase family enzyme